MRGEGMRKQPGSSKILREIGVDVSA